jgi:hypothetical protein
MSEMRFGSVKEALEFFIYAELSRDSVRSLMDSIYAQAILPNNRTGAPSVEPEGTGDVFYMVDDVCENGIPQQGAEPIVPWCELDLQREEVYIARVDLERILNRFDHREKLALFVYALAGFNHAVNALTAERDFNDVWTYLMTVGRKQAPGVNGGQQRRMERVLTKIEILLEDADYLCLQPVLIQEVVRQERAAS